MQDPTNPQHYQARGAECITITEGRDFLLGNAMKYLWRAGLKGPALTDLLKSRWYLDRAIKREGQA